MIGTYWQYPDQTLINYANYLVGVSQFSNMPFFHFIFSDGSRSHHTFDYQNEIDNSSQIYNFPGGDANPKLKPSDYLIPDGSMIAGGVIKID